MPRQSFFSDFRKRIISDACRLHRHEECEGEVYLGSADDYPRKWRPCDCVCHLEERWDLSEQHAIDPHKSKVETDQQEE